MLNPSKNLRIDLLKIYYEAKCGHIACSLSCIDVIYSIFKFKDPNERFILSKGHAAGALYIVLNKFGEITNEELNTFYKDGTKLSAHPSANSFTNIPFALGSLGHGLPISCGIAFSNKILKNNNLTYVLMSDGETNEGTTWEAANFAVKNQLSNLILFIDKNKLQGFGRTDDVLGDTADFEIWEKIGFDVQEIYGHEIDLIISTLSNKKNSNSTKPKLIILNTIKGKGVDFMENKLEWHYLPMNTDQYIEAQKSVNQIYYNEK
jgi:transketolase